MHHERHRVQGKGTPLDDAGRAPTRRRRADIASVAAGAIRAFAVLSVDPHRWAVPVRHPRCDEASDRARERGQERPNAHEACNASWAEHATAPRNAAFDSPDLGLTVGRTVELELI